MKVVEEVRLERLLLLKARHGSFAAINKIIGRDATDSTLSQIANRSTGSKTAKPKTMGSPQARLLEEKLDLERGWMDTDPALIGAGSPWPFSQVTPAQYALVATASRNAAEGVLLAALPLEEIGPLVQRESRHGLG